MGRSIRRMTRLGCAALAALWAGCGLAGVVYERTVSVLGPGAGPRGTRSVILTTEIEGGLARTEAVVLGTQAEGRRGRVKRGSQGSLVLTDLDREVLIRLQPRVRRYNEIPFSDLSGKRAALADRSGNVPVLYEWKHSDVRSKTTPETDEVSGVPVRLVQFFLSSSGSIEESGESCDVEWTLDAWLADPRTGAPALQQLLDYRRRASAKLHDLPDDVQSAGRAVLQRLDRYGQGWRRLLEAAGDRGVPLHSELALEAEGTCATPVLSAGRAGRPGSRRANIRKLRERRAGEAAPEADPESSRVPLPPLPEEGAEEQPYEGPLLKVTIRTDRLRVANIPKERFAIPEGYRSIFQPGAAVEPSPAND